MIGTPIAEWSCKSIKFRPENGPKYIVATVDHLVEKWMGFYKTPNEAQLILESRTNILSEKYLIVSSSKQLIDNNLKDRKGLLLFKFTIIKAIKG